MNTQLAQRQDQLKPFLMAAQRQITSLLSDDVRAKKFMAASLVVASSDQLKKCDPESIVQALVGVAMSDLNIDSNVGQCYLVPYGAKAQLQIGYKGFIQLLFRAGWMVKCLPVYHCDEFSMSFNGWDNAVEFTQNIDGRDEGDRDWVVENIRGIYVVSRHSETKEEYSTFVSKAVIEKLRLTSPNQRIGNYTKAPDKERLKKGLPIGIWADWYVEMAQAKAIKKLAKILPIGDSRASTIIAMDDKVESGIPVNYSESSDSGVVIDMESTKEESIELSDLIAAISAAKNNDELNSLSGVAEKFTGEDIKRIRIAWKEKSNELKPKNTTNVDGKTAIENYQTAEELTVLVNTMSEADQLKYSDEIDAQYDSFR
jgi:recombination protein RecT